MKHLNLTRQIAILTLSCFTLAGCSKSSAPAAATTSTGTTTGTGTSTGTGTTTGTTTTTMADVPALDDQITAFMTTYNVPALAVAITKDEKLVYVKSYGISDKSANKKAANTDLYRLASLSKQLTSVTIMKLLDQGKINLQSKVFGASGILGTKYGTKAYGKYITDITVDQLLHHTAGGWGNSNNDPMFLNPSLTQDQLITYTLDNIPLVNAPGTNYDYSNFGYCLLGRVIEKITGQTYEQAVKALILTPIGITDMTISGNTLADRISNEVVYYGQSNEDPYAYNIRRMDSHGGWLATATDLAKLLVYIDGFNQKPDILTTSAEQVMTTGSTANSTYGCGWSLNSGNYFHQGSLPGTATEQARTTQGYNFVILTNTRSLNTNFTSGLDQIFWNAYAKNPTWGTQDLF